MTETAARRFLVVLLGCSLAGLTGCSRDMSDLDQYVAEIKARPPGPIDPIPQMAPYEPFAYSQHENPSPFQSFVQEDKKVLAEQNRSTSTLQPDFSRNREPLEEFPLDGIRMLGTLDFRQQRFALLSAPDGVVHRATHGDHMGQNFGKIVQITESEVRLEEIVPDGLGGYVKRPAIVAISEK